MGVCNGILLYVGSGDWDTDPYIYVARTLYLLRHFLSGFFFLSGKQICWATPQNSSLNRLQTVPYNVICWSWEPQGQNHFSKR